MVRLRCLLELRVKLLHRLRDRHVMLSQRGQVRVSSCNACVVESKL